ncbi:MAG: hypothetical protein HY708_00870 [Ignavibacteriae bacterium]|nr:hypothetical protein [Ignavibacteriota bacterium]
MFMDVQVSDSSVMLSWAASTSEDVQAHVLYRRVSEQKRWEPLITLSRTADRYVDKGVNQNTMYEYLIEALDSSGYRTPAELSVQARPYDTGVRSPVTGLRASYDEGERRVILSWSYSPRKQESFYYVVYRATAASALSQYKSVSSTRQTFLDAELVGPGTYEYAIKVMTESGAQSPLSERARVTVSSR